MTRYIFKRILMMIPVLLGVSMLIFVLQAVAPGDPADLILGDNATEQEKNDWREEYGLNDSIPVQYVKYVKRIITKFDFGTSYRTNQSITKQIMERWPVTFLLAFMTTSVAALIGISLGIVAALHRGKWLDDFARILGMIGISLPNFWFALLLIMLFSLNLGWLPVSGFYGPRYWVLPALTLGLLGSAAQIRITRSSMLDNIQQDFVRTARAKGQCERKVTLHHILRNALIPIITSIGGLFAINMGGAMVLEQIFAIPGLGSLMVTAINQRDYPQLRGSVLLIAFTVSVINLLIDITYAAVDPRVKARFKTSVKIKRNVKGSGVTS